MSYETVKRHDGKSYSGMAVGRSHSWVYQPGVWDEVKRTPDEWSLDWSARKVRVHAAPSMSGAELGCEYRWLIVATQHVRKADKDTYETRLVGRKFKLAHKRPAWIGWSCDYPDQESLGARYGRFMAEASMRFATADVEGVAA